MARRACLAALVLAALVPAVAAAQTVSVSGTVVDQGTNGPLAGVSLTLDDGNGHQYTATSAADGSFTFSGVTPSIPETSYGLSATRTGYHNAGRSLVVPSAGVAGVALSMVPTSATVWTISGTVTDATTGKGIAWVAGVSVASPTIGTSTDGSGAFSLSGLPDGTYTLTATMYGYHTGTQTVTVHGADVTGVAIALSPYTLPTYTLSGTVTDASTHSGIDGATITLTLPNKSTQTATTSGGGHYAFSNLAAGTYDLLVTATEYQWSSITGLQVSANTTQDFSLLRPTTGGKPPATGCGCSATGGSADPVLGLVFLGLGLAVLRRRRGRSR